MKQVVFFIRTSLTCQTFGTSQCKAPAALWISTLASACNDVNAIDSMVKRWFCFSQKLALNMSHFVGLQTCFKGTCDQPCDKGTGGTSKTHEFSGKFQTAFDRWLSEMSTLRSPTPVILDILTFLFMFQWPFGVNIYESVCLLLSNLVLCF